MTRLLTALCLLASTASVFAADFSMYGTLAQGYIRTDHNNYFGDSTRGSFDFRELGIGASAQLSPDLRVSGMLMSRRAGATADGKPSVDYLLLDYAPIKLEQSTLGVKIGRQKMPFGFYNETRDVAETRPSILLPQSIYFDNARQFLINGDGVQLYGEQWNGGAYTKVSLTLMMANGVDNPETTAYFLGLNTPGYIQPHLATGLKIEHTDGNTELAAWVANTPLEYRPGTMDYVSSGKIHVTSAILSARHTFEHFIVTSEVFTAKTDYTGFGPYLPAFTSYPLGAYVQVEWLASEKWQGYSRYDAGYTSSHDMTGAQMAAATGKPASSFYAKDTMVGARYRFSATTSVAAEVHSVRGTMWLPVSDNKSGNITPDYNIFALQVSHSF